MPRLRADRLGEYARKAVDAALREVGQAPEHRAARRLRGVDAAGGPHVVFLTPRNWAYHVQVEALIGQALRARGARVTFITCGGGLEICDRVNTWEGPPMPCRECTGYVQHSIDAHGFARVSLLSFGMSPGPWPDLDAATLSELRDVADDGLPLGELARIPSAWFRMSARDNEDPLAALTTRRFLRSARSIAGALDAAFTELEPSVVMTLNGTFLFESIAGAIAKRRGIDVVSYERGFIDGTLFFRRGLPASSYDISETWDDWAGIALDRAETERLDGYLADRVAGRRDWIGLWRDADLSGPQRPHTGKLVALFTNLTWDSAVIGAEVAFADIESWLVAAVEAFADRPDDQLVVRIHPAEVRLPGKPTREPLGVFLRERFPNLPANVTLIDADDPRSSYPIMDACDIGLVYTSTTGLELALTGKPVIVAGRTHYRGKGFTTDVDSPEEFASALDKLLDDPAAVPVDVERARRYAYSFFFRSVVDAPWVREPVPGLARLDVSDPATLALGGDPGLDRICDGILFDEPFGEQVPAARQRGVG